MEDARQPEKRAWVGDNFAGSDKDMLLSALLANPMRIEEMAVKISSRVLWLN